MEADKNTNVVMEGEVLEKVIQPTKKNSAMEKLIGVLVFLIVFVLVLGGSAWGYLQYKKMQNQTAKPLLSSDAQVAKKTKYPPLPLAQGPQTYTGSFGTDFKGIRPTVIQLTTIDPGMNGKQKVDVTIVNDSPITNVSANVKTDNKITNHPMIKVSGTDMNGVWEGEWVVDDTYQNRWFLEFDIKSATGSYKDGLAFRYNAN